MEHVIEVKELEKRYGDLVAVNGISFAVERGEIFGLLGENGAGKTTTLEIIEGLRKPTGGTAHVLGHSVITEGASMKQKIGVQLQSSAYYNYLKLGEMLDLFASFYGKTVDAEALLGMVDLKDKIGSYVTQLSGGQRQRFSIMASMVNDPEIVFLDEPTTGLDPLARRNLWDLIRAIKAQGKTVVITTHYLEEAEMLCDRVAIMEHGNIIAQDKTNRLIEKATYPYTISFEAATPDQKVLKKLGEYGALEEQSNKPGHFKLSMPDQEKLGSAIDTVRLLDPIGLAVRPASLEDVFIELTGKSLNENEQEVRNG